MPGPGPAPPRLPSPFGACPWDVMGHYAPCPAGLGHGSESARALLMTPRGSRCSRQIGATWKIKLGEWQPCFSQGIRKDLREAVTCLWAVPCAGLGRGLLGRGTTSVKALGWNCWAACAAGVQGGGDGGGVVEGCGTLGGIGALLLGAVESCRPMAGGPHGSGDHDWALPALIRCFGSS